MHGRESVFARAEAITAVLLAAGQRARAEQLCSGILTRLSSRPTPQFSEELVVREAEAAGRVEAARAAFQARGEHHQLEALERAIREHERVERDLDAAAAQRISAERGR
jgi:hypothetical protein